MQLLGLNALRMAALPDIGAFVCVASELGLFCLEKRKCQGDLTVVFQYLEVVCKKGE